MGVQHRKILHRYEESNKEIQSVSEVYYTEEAITECKELFNQYKRDGLIVEGSFQNDLWKVKKSNTRNGTLNLIFDIDMYPKLKLALKVYLVYQLNNMTTSQAQQQLKYIKRGILTTNGFNVRRVDALEVDLDSVMDDSESYAHYYTRAILSFLEFIQHPDYLEFEACCEGYSQPDVKVRKLIPFSDLLDFGDVMDRFELSCTPEEKLLFYPIILWWRITNFIPMRTSEFIDIKRDCLKVINDKYFIVLPRKKQKRVRHGEIEITDTVPITENIYRLVSDYIQFTNPYGESEQLLSNSAHCEAIHRKAVSDYWDAERFRVLLNRFYDEIVIRKFGHREDIKRLKPMDTRHYAFMNLMFQGFNPLTIARMGGHKKLSSQFHYCNHLEEFADSYVHNLTQRKWLKKYDLSTQSYIDPKHPALLMGKTRDKNSFPFWHKLKPFGACTFDLERYGCPNGGGCRHCEFFVLPYEEQTPEAIKWLQDCSLEIAQKIREQIALMQEATKGIQYDLSRLDWFSCNC